MSYFGCHLSASKGYVAMINTARSIDANTFAFLPGIPEAVNPSRKILKMKRELLPCWQKKALALWLPTEPTL